MFTRPCSLSSGLAEVDESATTSIVVWRPGFILVVRWEGAVVLSFAALTAHSILSDRAAPHLTARLEGTGKLAFADAQVKSSGSSFASNLEGARISLGRRSMISILSLLGSDAAGTHAYIRSW